MQSGLFGETVRFFNCIFIFKEDCSAKEKYDIFGLPCTVDSVTLNLPLNWQLDRNPVSNENITGRDLRTLLWDCKCVQRPFTNSPPPPPLSCTVLDTLSQRYYSYLRNTVLPWLSEFGIRLFRIYTSNAFPVLLPIIQIISNNCCNYLENARDASKTHFGCFMRHQIGSPFCFTSVIQ